MKANFLILLAAVLIAVTAPSRAQILADLAADYQPGTGGVMSPLSDSHGTGTWTYNLAQVNNSTLPTGYSNLEPLTYEANHVGGPSPYYGTTPMGYSSNIIDLPAVSNGQIFSDSPSPAADFLEVHPSAEANAALLRWTAGAGEVGNLSLTFDLSRTQVNPPADFSLPGGAGYLDFTIYRDSTLIYSSYDMYTGTDTGTLTLPLLNVTTGTTLNFVVSSSEGTLGFNLGYLKADISAVPEPSTWLMMAGGLVMLGFWFRRRIA